jgi:UDP-N-acetylglucosamine--N-acetylmuramyl-(pentapeptide) pyrophosphoryl-undecaprenol N-acetylglucosamine transferase
MALSVVLAGGGTGGHVFPALALADAIRARVPDAKLRFIGTARGLETRYVPRAGYPLDTVSCAQVLGRGPLDSLAALWAAARGTLQARRILREAKAQVVIGVGGYASVPAVVAAWWLGIPTGLVEPNARPGRANRMLAYLSRAVFLQFQDAGEYFPAERCRITGLPIRHIPVSEGARRTTDGRFSLVVVGGSQGARSVNRAVVAALAQLSTVPGIAITHQTGEAQLDEVRKAYAAAGLAGEVAAFFDDLPARFAQADLVVARAGAATCAELCAAAAPSILVPYPFAADDHQSANANELARAGAAVVIADAELESRLADAVLELAVDPERRERMHEAARGRARPDAAERIWDVCELWLREVA